MRAKHDSTSLELSEPTETTFFNSESEDHLPHTPTQLPRSSTHLSSRNGVQFKGISTPDPINMNLTASPGQFGTCSDNKASTTP